MRRKERQIRQTVYAQANKDVLPIDKLVELRVLWQDRLAQGTFSEPLCKRMISLYDIRISRLEDFSSAKVEQAQEGSQADPTAD